jgi:Transglycosylase SLT domain
VHVPLRDRSISVALSALVLIITGIVSRAQPPAKASVCFLLDSAATANGLPVEFLARAIWRESRFRAGAVGPPTRSGTRAQGIAQFMPATAAERDLADPFDPVQALPKAAAYLHDLRNEFGNLGLAAAAYDARPQRVHEWLAGTKSLPVETKRYVKAVTGLSANAWSKPGATAIAAPKNCAETLASLGHGASFAIALHSRVEAALAHPWGVELAAGFSRQHVLADYARQTGRLADIIGRHDPVADLFPPAQGGTPRDPAQKRSEPFRD